MNTVKVSVCLSFFCSASCPSLLGLTSSYFRRFYPSMAKWSSGGKLNFCELSFLQIPGRLYPIEVRYQPPKVEVSDMWGSLFFLSFLISVLSHCKVGEKTFHLEFGMAWERQNELCSNQFCHLIDLGTKGFRPPIWWNTVFCGLRQSDNDQLNILRIKTYPVALVVLYQGKWSYRRA